MFSVSRRKICYCSEWKFAIRDSSCIAHELANVNSFITVCFGDRCFYSNFVVIGFVKKLMQR